MAATVLLVHGTAAPNAPWTQPGSPLRTEIESLAPPGEILCKPVGWSGSNFHSHRIAAAEKLAAEIKGTFDLEPERKVVVVGHSHGGTIASLMLSRHPSIATRLTGVVYLSTPFIVASRRPHTEKLRRMSERLLPMLDALACFFIWLLLYALLSISKELLDLLEPILSFYLFGAIYGTGRKLTCTRLPGISTRLWLANLISVHFSIFAPLALAAIVYRLLFKFSFSTGLALTTALIAFACFAFASMKIFSGMKLLCETVGETSHIANSIQRLLSDFQLSSLPSGKALVVRFTSDEASLVLAIAQATTKLIDLFVVALVAFFTTFGASFWKAARRSIGVPKRIFWLAVLAMFLILFTKTTLGFLSIILGLVFTSIDSVVDALMHGRLPEKWNFFSSAPIRIFELLDPYLWWSIDFSSGHYTNNPFNWAALVVVMALSACGLVLALPFGATSFWGALYVSFSVESAPAGECDIITFTPSLDGLTDDGEFWAESNLAHSLAYLDKRSIQAATNRIAEWVQHP